MLHHHLRRHELRHGHHRDADHHHHCDSEIALTAIATNIAWTDDLTAAYATSVYELVLSWWSVEDAAATATPTATETTSTQAISTPSPGTWSVFVTQAGGCPTFDSQYAILSGSTSNQCINLYNISLPTSYTGSGVSCRYYESSPDLPFNGAASWEIQGATCVVYQSSDCSTSELHVQYSPQGCQEYNDDETNIPSWFSIKYVLS